MKKLMILGASILQVPAILKAKEMNLDVIVVDMNPKAVGFDIEGVKKEVISTIDMEGVLKAARKHNIDGIMTVASDMPMAVVSKVCRELGLSGISEDTALKATNKAFMRDALKANNAPIPLYFRVNSLKEYFYYTKEIFNKGYKCIVKPADNSGSRGVSLITSINELEKSYQYAISYSRSGEIVVEEFMDGPEVSVETIAVDGCIHVIQITDKSTTGVPYFVEMGHSQPSKLNEKTKKEIAEIAIAANKAIGIDNGPSHTEIKVTKDGPKIVEIGARLGGDCITSHLVPLSTGIDMVEASICIALGEKPNCIKKWNRGAAIRYFNPKPGIIYDITGLDKVKNTPGVEEVVITRGIGEHVKTVMNSVDRVGYIITQGKTADEAIDLAEMELKKILFYVR